MKSQQGRKALFILGDGGHIGDRGDRAIAAARQADTLERTLWSMETAVRIARGFLADDSIDPGVFFRRCWTI
jgi:hypothetical protein